MFEIKLTVDPEFTSAINALAAAIGGQTQNQTVAVISPAVTVTNETKPEQPKTETPAQEEPKIQTTEEPKPETTEEPKQEYTLEQVRAKLAALSQDGKQAQVKKIITEAGAKKLTEIPPEKYAEVMAKAGAI